MDQRESAPVRPPLESLRALGASFLALVHTRIELALVELREEAERRKEVVVLAAVGGVFLALGALLLAMSIVVFFWDTHRLRAAVIVTGVYLGIGLFALWRISQRRRTAPPLFEATLGEIAKDVEALRSRPDE